MLCALKEHLVLLVYEFFTCTASLLWKQKSLYWAFSVIFATSYTCCNRVFRNSSYWPGKVCPLFINCRNTLKKTVTR